MKIRIMMCMTLVAAFASATTLLEERFESQVTGSVDGQNGWTILDGTAVVQTNIVQEGLQGLQLGATTVRHDVASTNNLLWLRFQARISAAPASTPSVSDSNTSAAFCIGTNLHVVAYSNSIPVDTGVAMPLDVWTRFDVFCDFDNLCWNLSMDGLTIAEALPLYSSNTAIDSVQIVNAGSDPAYVDHIYVTDHEQASGAPDSDGDGIADWWELENFGGITACDASAPSGNAGMTYLDAYITGTDPFAYDPFVLNSSVPGTLSWQASPERTYDVEWTPNLSSNFTVVSSVQWPEESYTDPDHTGYDAGFYRIKASIQ